MPWRKYKTSPSKYGEVYTVDKGIRVRMDARGKWTVFSDRNEERSNKTIGAGREGLVKAIKLAEALKTKLLLMPVGGTEKPESDIPKFSDYSQQWHSNNSARWHINTVQRYEEILRLHIWPSGDFAGKRLNEIDRQLLKRFYGTLFKTRSAATVEAAQSIVSSILDEAIDDRLISVNPTKGILRKILPPHKKRCQKEADPLDHEERQRFLKSLAKCCTWPEQMLFKMMIFSGCRLGEALAMRLRHMDTHKLTYHVSESFKNYRCGKPKSGKKRIVDLPAFLVDELKEYALYLRKGRLEKGSGEEVDLLFSDPAEPNGWPYSQRKVQGLMKRICKKAGLRQRNPHDLRHTYATTLLMAHQSPAYVQKQLGHSSIGITVDTYGHWVPGEGRKGLEEALLGSVPNPGENRIFSHMEKEEACN